MDEAVWMINTENEQLQYKQHNGGYWKITFTLHLLGHYLLRPRKHD